MLVLALLRARAEIQANRHDFESALADCEQALQSHPDDLDGYLLRGRLLSQLGRYAEAATGFQAGYAQTGSVVLRNQWIESLIDAGDCLQAVTEIETELALTRWKSSWLIRRARARLCLSQHSDATSDLRAAIEEMDARLNPRRPDVTLLADRGLARALLGELDRAREDLREAQALGADAWVVERLQKTLEKIERDPENLPRR